MCVQVPTETRIGSPLEMELKVVVNSQTRELGTELRSSGRAGSIKT